MLEPTAAAEGNKIVTGGELPLSFKTVHFFNLYQLALSLL